MVIIWLLTSKFSYIPQAFNSTKDTEKLYFYFSIIYHIYREMWSDRFIFSCILRLIKFENLIKTRKGFNIYS